ncbi:MAG TPA: peptidoglycan DD-metalloendopeptidase family protein [Vicinamibacterales bacterium]
MRRVLQLVVCVVIAGATLTLHSQTSSDPNQEQADRAARRIRALQAESDRLAAQSRTVFGELRKLEIDRALKQEELSRVDRELVRVTVDRDTTARRLEELEAIRIAGTPGVAERLVELSKRGRAGYVQLLLASDDVRAMGRMARGVAAVAELDRMRLETHRKNLAAEKTALDQLTRQRAAAAALQKDAARAKAAVDATVNARNRMIDDLDRRRDLAAQYVAELQQAQSELEKTVASAEGTSRVVALPIRPFRGDLPWPLQGDVVSRFGRAPAGRFGTSIVRNGIEVAGREGAEIKAVHEGSVAYAAPFTGFGTLVIVDHGSNAFTLYGHLADAVVTAGTNVSRGTVLGNLGQSPSGGAAAYFEVRIDGRPTDPLQWLRRSQK